MTGGPVDIGTIEAPYNDLLGIAGLLGLDVGQRVYDNPRSTVVKPILLLRNATAAAVEGINQRLRAWGFPETTAERFRRRLDQLREGWWRMQATLL